MFFMDSLLDGDDDDATVVSAITVNASPTTASPILSTLGAAAGDFAFVLDNGGAPNSDGAGAWTGVSNGSPTLGSFYYKQLNSTDVAGTIRPGVNNVAWTLMIMRGLLSTTSVRTGTGTADPNSAAGITRDVNHAGLVGLVTQRNGSGETITGFATAGTDVAISTYAAKLMYRTSPPSTPYANGTAFSYGSGGGSPGTNYYLVIAELRR